MSDVTITLNNTEIATLNDTGIARLKTSGKRMDGDVLVQYEKPSAGVTGGGEYHVISVDNGDGTQDIQITDADGAISVVPLNAAENRTYTAPDGQAYNPVTVNVLPTGGKAAQASDAMERVNSTSLTATTVMLTVEKTGTYTVRWFAYRTNTGGASTSSTSGSQLYIGDTGYGTENTTFEVNSNGQTNLLTGVRLTAGQTITVRARARYTSSYTFVMGLSIIEE